MNALSATPAPTAWMLPVSPYLAAVRDAMRAITPPEGELLAMALAQSLEGRGKLLRPTLTLLCTLVTLPEEGTPETRHLETAAAAELIHIATLLHDDVLDDADLRRGHPTVRARLGNRTSILAGDYLLAQASCKLARVGDLRVVSLFSDVLAHLCDGEVEQLRASYHLSANTWDSYRRKTLGKTASLFAACCNAPALLNGASDDVATSLRLYGEHVGMAFQIMDDLLDFTASEAELGKPVMDDLRHGLMNAPMLLALDSPCGSLLEPLLSRLFQALTHEPSDASHVDGILSQIAPLMVQAQAFEKTQELAQSYAQQAIESLHVLASSAAKTALIDLARFTLTRRS